MPHQVRSPPRPGRLPRLPSAPAVNAELLRVALGEIEKIVCGSSSTNYQLHVWVSGELYIAVFPVEHREVVYRYLNFKLRLDVPAGGDPLVLTRTEAAGVLGLVST